MKILHVGKFYYPYRGGIESVVKGLCEGMRKYHNLTMDVLCSSHNGPASRDTIDGIPVQRVRTWDTVFSTPISPSLVWALNNSNHDMLMFHLPNPMATMAMLLARPRGKIAAWWHADIPPKPIAKTLYSRFLHMFLDRVDAIVAATPRHIDFSDTLPAYRSKCRVIPCGTELNFAEEEWFYRRVAPFARREFSNRTIILAVGRLVGYKGFSVLIDAMQAVQDAILVLVGDGPLYAPLMMQAAEQPEKVFMLGEVSTQRLYSLIYACDMFCLPSVDAAEAFGMVQIEAMMAGKPIVSTDLPTGVPWVNQHGKTGLVVPPGDPRELAAALQRLVWDHDLRHELGKGARQRYEAEFTLERMSDRMYNFAAGLLGQPTRAEGHRRARSVDTADNPVATAVTAPAAATATASVLPPTPTEAAEAPATTASPPRASRRSS